MSGSSVKSARRSEAMAARWADPEKAARMRANLAKGRGHVPPATPAPADPPAAGGAAPAADPFSERRLFGRRRSTSE